MSESRNKKKRLKYIRPCDTCSRRRVRCEQKRPCFRCQSLGIDCTDKRGRKKPGPQIKLEKTGEETGSFKTNERSEQDFKITNIAFDDLFPFLQMYQSWFYGVWPVLSVDTLIANILESLEKNGPDDDYFSYALGCALCAAISRRIGFLTSDKPIQIPDSHQPSYFAAEALRIRYVKMHRDNPCEYTLLSCFFLYCYYGISDGGMAPAILYLREAISIAQILRLNDINTYMDMDEQKSHRMRKIYYMLLITERYICIEDKLPIVLELTIPYPALEDEEYPTMLEGFIELVKVFSFPDRKFFDNISNDLHNSSHMMIFEQLLQGSENSFSAHLIIKIQDHLLTVNIKNYMSEIQQVNILLSQHWMKSLAWRVSKKQHLVTCNMAPENCLSSHFPITIARNFLNATQHLPLFAFESNGRGVRLKLLEIADSLTESYSSSLKYNSPYDEILASQVLEKVFELVRNLRHDVTLPSGLYHKIETIVNSRSLAASDHFVTLSREDSNEFNNRITLRNELFSDAVTEIEQLPNNETKDTRSRSIMLAFSLSEIYKLKTSSDNDMSWLLEE